MKAKWILQTNIFKETAVNKMIGCFKQQDIPYQLIKIIPFSEELPEIDEYDGPMLAYGTTTLLKNLNKNKQIFPGMWFDGHTFRPSNWSSYYHQHILNPDYLIAKNPFSVLHHFEEKNTHLFLRPNDDYKLFTGQVFSKKEYYDWLFQLDKMEFDTQIVVSQPKQIIAEWRYIVIDGEIITGSRYRLRGRLNTSSNPIDMPKEAEVVIKKILKNWWQPEDAYVVDVAQTESGFKIIEINCLNASGFYDADVNAIIHYASKLAEKQYKAEEEKWAYQNQLAKEI